MDVNAEIYPPFNPKMGPESIRDKQDFCQRGIDMIVYLLMSHCNKIWYMETHKTLTEARHLFGSMYNPIKCFIDLYLDVPMPSTYKDCKFTMKYHEYMRWELVYFTSDLEVSCRHLKEFINNCTQYKCLDLLAKIISKVKRPFERYCVCNCFWENKIKK